MSPPNLNSTFAGVTRDWPLFFEEGMFYTPAYIGYQMNKNEIRRINQNAGGSTLTRKGRESTLVDISRVFREDLNIQIKSFSDLKVRHIERYIEHAKKKGLSKRTMQNHMSRIRSALRELGREKFTNDERISNKELGLGNASRDGTHIPFSKTEEELRIEEIQDLGSHAAALLQRSLGLRMTEAIRSAKWLKHWEAELKSKNFLEVVEGTKGGRRRLVDFKDQQAKSLALEAVRNAIRVMGDKGQLIESISLEGACRKYLRELARVGFKGAQGSHSLRCNWARDQFTRHLQNTRNSSPLALAMLSLDLGHGDKRGRYCRQVYLKGMYLQPANL